MLLFPLLKLVVLFQIFGAYVLFVRDKNHIDTLHLVTEPVFQSYYRAADIFLWRDKKIFAGVLGVATTIWVFFELLEYHLLTLVCHILILTLAIFFLWSNASAFINKSPPRIPEVIIPEDFVLGVASALRIEFNRTFAILRDIASERDLKQFLAEVDYLWDY